MFYPYSGQAMMNPMMGGGRADPLGAPPLFIGNLDETVYDEALFSHFSKYGPIHSLKIIKDHTTGKSRGYCFLNFMNAKDGKLPGSSIGL